MKDDNESPDDPIAGSTMADVAREGIRAFRDILNDWRVATALLIMILLLLGKVAGNDLMSGVEGWIRAWRGQP